MNKRSDVTISQLSYTTTSTLSSPMSVSAVHSAHVPTLHPVTTAVASTDQLDRADRQLNSSTAVLYLNTSSTSISSRAEYGCVGVSSDVVGVSGAGLGVQQNV